MSYCLRGATKTCKKNEMNRFVEYTAFICMNHTLIEKMIKLAVEEALKADRATEECELIAGETIMRNFYLRANVSWLYLERLYRTGFKSELTPEAFAAEAEKLGINSHGTKISYTSQLVVSQSTHHQVHRVGSIPMTGSIFVFPISEISEAQNAKISIIPESYSV